MGAFCFGGYFIASADVLGCFACGGFGDISPPGEVLFPVEKYPKDAGAATRSDYDSASLHLGLQGWLAPDPVRETD